MRVQLVPAVAVLLVAGCGGSSNSGHPAAAAANGDKAVCQAFQLVADALVAKDATTARAALSKLKVVAPQATSPALKADALGLAAATDGPTAAGFGRKIPDDCKAAGQTLSRP